MYMINNMNQIQKLFNKLKKLFFVYSSDQSLIY